MLLRQRITLLLGSQKLPIEVMTLRNYYAKSAMACEAGSMTNNSLASVNRLSVRVPAVRSREELYRECRSSAGGGGFLGRNLVFEVVRVETVESTLGRFGLRIH